MSTAITKVEGKFAEMRVDDAIVVMGIDSGAFFGLKATGLAIWELIDGTRTAEGIVADLAARYDVEAARCAADVRAFLSRLAEAGFVSVT